MMPDMEEKTVKPRRTVKRTILIGSGLGTVVWLVLAALAATWSKANPDSHLPSFLFGVALFYFPYVVVSAMNVWAWFAFPVATGTKWRIAVRVVLRAAAFALLSFGAVSALTLVYFMVTIVFGPNIP